MLESLLLLCWVYHIFKCAVIDNASRHVYLHVYCVTSACVCLTLRRAVVEGGGSGCGERSAQRLSSGRWCDTEAGWAQMQAAAPLCFLLACLSLICPLGNGKVITNLHRKILYPPLAPEHNAYNTTSNTHTHFTSLQTFWLPPTAL